MTDTDSASVKPDPNGNLDYTLGGLELDTIFNGKDKIDASGQELAIEFLRRSEQVQLERLQCITDGAELGAEQVQDVRLDLLEKGPEVNTSAVIIELFIGFLLDSSIPGRLLKGFANSVCKKMVIRNRALYATELKSIREICKDPRKFRSEYYLNEIFKADLKSKVYLDNSSTWRKVGEFATNSDWVKDGTALGKTGARVYDKKFSSKPLSIDGDTPGVSLLSSVQEFSAINRLTIRFQYQRMETFIRLGFMTGEQARSFLSLAEFEPLQSPLKIIRDRCKLLFEAIIWAGIFGFDKNKKKVRAGGAFSNAQLEGIDERLANYWIRRFEADIRKWINDMGPQELKKLGLLAIGDWNSTPYIAKLSYIEHYFSALVADLPQSLEDAKVMASSFSK